MVQLKSPDDGFERNPSHGFIAIGSPSRGSVGFALELFNRLRDAYDWSDRPIPKPFRNVLVTPVALSKNRSAVHYLKELREEGIIDHVMFDSGGFQVLTGAYRDRGINNLEDLQKLNEKIYNEEDWADVYIMPDHPASKDDTQDSLDPNYNIFGDKAKKTVDAALSFFECLSPTVQGKVAPVFHLQRDADIDFFYNGYKPILEKSKFASYSASSLTPAGSARQLTLEVLQMIDLLLKKLKPEGIGLHCLGLAAPSAVFCMNYLGVTAFDASTPIIGAGLGKVFFPYYGALSCSELRDKEDHNLTQETLEFYRKVTGHKCPFCEDINQLSKRTEDLEEGEVPGYWYRRLHNLTVLDEYNWHYHDFNFDLLEQGAPIMHQNLMKVLNFTDQLSFL